MSEIKRWSVSINPQYYDVRCQTVEDPSGCWVDYRDHAAAIAAKDAEIERLRAVANAAASVHEAAQNSVTNDVYWRRMTELGTALHHYAFPNPIARASVERPL